MRKPHLDVVAISRRWVFPALLGLGACIPEISFAASEVVVTEIAEPRIEKYLQAMVRDEHFSGAALVARNKQVVHAKGYGSAYFDVPNTVATVFHVASVTKQFTAAAILQLAEDGVLELNNSINEYLPGKYKTATWAPVTVHHLLSHSSGIADYAVFRDYYEVVNGFCSGKTVDGMVREAMSKELEFIPGSQYAYSNIGFALLGLIIEHQANTPYEQYMMENILMPLGMTSSRIHVEGHVPTDDEARGHRWDMDKELHVKDDVVSLPVTAPDGGLLTTLGDFLAWSQVFSDADVGILSSESISLMTRPQVEIGQGGPLDAYGYGLYVGDRLIGHGGSIVGFRSQFIYDRQTATLIAVFTNNTANSPQQIAFGVLGILHEPQE